MPLLLALLPTLAVMLLAMVVVGTLPGVLTTVGEVAVTAPQVGMMGEVTIVVTMGEVAIFVPDIVETGDWTGGF